jgi:hypothetical protein
MSDAAGASRMSSRRARVAPAASSPRRLRLIGADALGESGRTAPPAPRATDERDHVLVAGADAAARARMLEELRSLLPAGTRFVEASRTWELIARSAGSRMVVLTGDLDDVSAASLLRLLERRNPTLPVLAMGDTDRRSTGPSAPLAGELDAADA